MSDEPPRETKPAQSASKPPRRRRFRRRLFVALPVLLLALWLGVGYLHYDHQFLSTDDAYIGANQVQVGAQVAGLVTKAPCHNNRDVKRGQLLFTLDPTPFQAKVASARAALKTAKRQQATAQAAVQTAQAVLNQRHAEAHKARDHLRRLNHLSDQHFVSPQDLEDARAQVSVADAAVKQAAAALAQAKVNAGPKGDGNDRIQSAKAKLASAEYALSRTRVTAPMTGILANYGLEPGQTVDANKPLFSIVATRDLWVDANFKETEVAPVHIGDAATITSDIYPGRQFKGKVVSIAGGSGNAFSLLPPQNATGNWVKVTQRVPIRVRLDDNDPAHRLPIGTSTTTRIQLIDHPLSLWQSLLAVIGFTPQH